MPIGRGFRTPRSTAINPQARFIPGVNRHYKDSSMRALVFSAMILLAGCATQERIVTKEVMVPVPVKMEAPDWLAAGFKPESLPEFVSPSDPRATSALTKEGEQALRLLIIDLTNRDRAWQEWAR